MVPPAEGREPGGPGRSERLRPEHEAVGRRQRIASLRLHLRCTRRRRDQDHGLNGRRRRSANSRCAETNAPPRRNRFTLARSRSPINRLLSYASRLGLYNTNHTALPAGGQATADRSEAAEGPYPFRTRARYVIRYRYPISIVVFVALTFMPSASATLRSGTMGVSVPSRTVAPRGMRRPAE